MFNLLPQTMPIAIPAKMEPYIVRLKLAADKEACLSMAYSILTARYRGYRIKTYTKLFDLWIGDLDVLWEKRGFLHCTNLNYLLKVCLVQSGHFMASDIQYRWTQVNYLSPHQYVRVKIAENTLVDIDLWGKAYGVTFGNHASGLKL